MRLLMCCFPRRMHFRALLRNSRLRQVCAVVCMTTIMIGGVMGMMACNDLAGLAGTQSLPTGTPDPNSLRNPVGAVQLYNSAVSAFGQGQIGAVSSTGSAVDGVFVTFVWTSGLLADEFTVDREVNGSPQDRDYVNARTSSPIGSVAYSGLQGIRGQASVAIGSLAAYDDSAVALRGHLYALTGYADLLLADLFCSGVPLSTLNFNGNFTYAGPSTTTQMYQAAIAKFDTALTLSGDSVRFLNLARVGKGRAYWLYLTGQRQGDLRRLIRNYGRAQNTVYPTGQYPLQQLSRYGTAVDLQIPSSESVNPLYQGCVARGA